jgi:hypothetical protein
LAKATNSSLKKSTIKKGDLNEFTMGLVKKEKAGRIKSKSKIKTIPEI